MIKNKVLVVLCMFLLVLPIAFSVGTTENPNSGNVDYTWNSDGRGSFASIGNNFDTYGRSLINPKTMPVVADLDNNGVNEVVLIDGDTVKVFNNKELDSVSSYDFGSDDSTSNILLFDIDGDSSKEIIFVSLNYNSTTDGIHILDYSDGSGVTKKRTINIPGTAEDNTIVSCAGINECIAVTTSGLTNPGGAFTAFHYGIAFDSFGATDSQFTIYSEAQSADDIAICNPRIPSMPALDYDFDGRVEYIHSVAIHEASDSEYRVGVFYIDNNTVEQSSITTNSVDPDVLCTGEDGLSNMVTAPVAGDLTGDFAGMEIYVGQQTDDNEFKINVYDTTATFREDYPEFLNADGVLISNPVIGNFFPESDDEDVCVMGFDTETQMLDLLCGSRERGLVPPDADQFKISVANRDFNISTDITNLNNIIHGAQHSTVKTDNNDLDEVVTAYGIFRLDFAFSNELIEVFQFPNDNVLAYSIDLEQAGADDILVQSGANILYYDDRLTPTGGIIENVSYNPCIVDAIVKVNTTTQFTVYGKDSNNQILGFDNLNVNMFVYYNTIHQQNVTITNISTSSIDGRAIIIQNFDLNVTGLNEVFRVELWDNSNPTEVDEFEQLFSVAANGVEFGDSTCSVAVGADEVTGTPVNGSNPDVIGGLEDDDALSSSTNALSTTFNLTPFLIFMLIMLFVALGIVFSSFAMNNPLLGFLTIILAEVILLIVGTKIGAIPVGIIVTVVVIGIIVIGTWVARAFITPSNN